MCECVDDRTCCKRTLRLVGLAVAMTAGTFVTIAIELIVALVAMQAMDLAVSWVAMATDLAVAVAPPSTVAE